MERFKNILCVINTDSECETAIERAISLAESNQASLSIISVVEHDITYIGDLNGDFAPTDLQAAIVSQHMQELEMKVVPYRKRIKFDTKVLTGVSFLETIRQVLSNHHDLVIKMAETQDWLNNLFGSDDMHLLRKCPCPVWLIKPRATKSYKTILASVDVYADYASPKQEQQHALNLNILKLASSLAVAESAELHIANAWEAYGESALYGPFMHKTKEEINAYIEMVKQQHITRLDELVREAGNLLGKDMLEYINPQTHLVKGSARKEIPTLTQTINADLVVMGTIARSGIPGFIMGNTAESILNQINCSVLAIKPPGFVTPVKQED